MTQPINPFAEALAEFNKEDRTGDLYLEPETKATIRIALKACAGVDKCVVPINPSSDMVTAGDECKSAMRVNATGIIIRADIRGIYAAMITASQEPRSLEELEG